MSDHPHNYLEVFMKKVDKRSLNECWNWLASIGSNGYGSFRYNGGMEDAHRVAWKLIVGKIPKGKLVLHKCNNKRCVNPHHMYLGNQCDNLKDLKDTGFVPMSRRLTSDQVVNTRKDYTTGRFRCADLGRKYNILGSNVGAIVRRKTYREI